MTQPIPWPFIRERTRLSWFDASVGYHQHWLGWSGAVELACDRLSEGEDGALVVELAGVSKGEANRVGELLDKLASAEVTDEAASKAKWLYLNLAWLFENQDFVADPLEEVEGIYADFDYPEDVACFVRYMPVTDGYDPSTHSAAENQSRLFANWKGYLDRMVGIFHATSDSERSTSHGQSTS
jgi:hypothetical protein